MILNLSMFSCVVHPVVFLHRLCSHASIMICNECICLRLLGWHAPFYFFIPSMFSALGLHIFYKKRSNTYKDKDEGCGMDIPPNTMESDSATTLVQDSTTIFADDCRACLYRHLYALLHPQKSFGSLSVGDPSKLLRPIFKYLRASSQDYTNREATDRQQAGRNHTDTRKRNTHAHTSCKGAAKFPKWCSTTKNIPDDTMYIVPEQRLI